jgi:hypothetical protein
VDENLMDNLYYTCSLNFLTLKSSFDTAFAKSYKNKTKQAQENKGLSDSYCDPTLN